MATDKTGTDKTGTETTKRKAGRPKGSTTSSRARPTSAKARLREYERTLPQITLNDYEQLKTLVAIEEELENLRGQLAQTQDALSRRKLSEAITTYSKEYRLVLQSLGIERNMRSPTINMQDEVDRLVSASQTLVEAVGRRITCGHCQSDYDMGLILFHFADEVAWRFQFICPACGAPNQMLSIKALPDAPAV